jgi:hypothetical protein
LGALPWILTGAHSLCLYEGLAKGRVKRDLYFLQQPNMVVSEIKYHTLFRIITQLIVTRLATWFFIFTSASSYFIGLMLSSLVVISFFHHLQTSAFVGAGLKTHEQDFFMLQMA